MSSKLTNLTEITSPTADDLLYLVDNPGGVPLSRKITVANLLSSVDLSLYIPYTGATGNVDLGAFNITGQTFVVKDIIFQPTPGVYYKLDCTATGELRTTSVIP